MLKKITVLILTVNLVFAAWVWLLPRLMPGKQMLDIFCESTLNLKASPGTQQSGIFNFEGTVLLRFKPDATGYLWLLGNAKHQDAHYNVSREVNFRYKPKDINGIYTVTFLARRVPLNDNTPNALIERNITGPVNTEMSYVIRRTNKNTYSIGNIYSPIIMCVDKS